jgi:hypothetical protein
MAGSESEKMLRATDRDSELDAPIWAVISFERCEASGLTHAQAVKKLSELEAKHVTGLCIVADDAAARLAN